MFNMMKFLKRITSNANFWPLLIVIFFGLLAGRGLIGQGYFNMHDDLQMMRQLEMEKCFLSLQIPCRWVPDMGYGFGFPLFNFYPPLPYLVGEIVRLVGFSFVDTVKIVAVLAFVLSGVGMYFLAKTFFTNSVKLRGHELPLGAIVSAVFYMWAPYHSVDIYVRGAMNEAWALVWFPLTFLFSYKLIVEKNTKKYIILTSLAWAGLLLSHNLMAMIFAPLFGVWTLFWVIRKKAWRRIPHLALSGIFTICLTAFFTLPVVIEQKFTHADSLIQGYYEFNVHFASIRQILISRFWGYGPSVWGAADDRMSFQIGHIHWILSLVILAIIGYRFLKKRKLDDITLMLLILFFGGWFAAFMMHERSTFLWQLVPTLRYVQFPWRFLTLVIFCFSFLAGSITLFLPKKIGNLIIWLLVGGLIAFNWNFFLPERGHLGALTDNQKFSGVAWDLQRTAGIYDYLPNTAKTAPKAPRKELVEILTGAASVTNVYEKTNFASFDINVSQIAEIRLGIFKFPEWKVFVDGKEVETKVPETEEWGRMHVDVPVGEHKVEVKLYDTPIRTIGNVVSFMSWVGLGGYLVLQFRRGRTT